MDAISTYHGIEYKYSPNHQLHVIGVEVSEGQIHDGTQLTPNKLREANLIRVLKDLGWEIKDHGNIGIEESEETGGDESTTASLKKSYKYNGINHSLKIGDLCKKLHHITRQISEENAFSLILGGDQSLSTGSISGLKATYPNLKVIWIDAHADIHIPETSPPGNYNRMTMAHLLGFIGEGTVPGFDWFKPCLKPEDIVYIGLREVDLAEKIALRKNRIQCYDMHSLDKYGVIGVVHQALKYLDPESKGFPIHISLDIDAIDPSYAYGTGTKSRYGLSEREGHYLINEIANSGNLSSLEIVEINPLLEKDPLREEFYGDNPFIKGSPTVCLGADLICIALGKTWV